MNYKHDPDSPLYSKASHFRVKLACLIEEFQLDKTLNKESESLAEYCVNQLVGLHQILNRRGEDERKHDPLKQITFPVLIFCRSRSTALNWLLKTTETHSVLSSGRYCLVNSPKSLIWIKGLKRYDVVVVGEAVHASPFEDMPQLREAWNALTPQDQARALFF